MRSWPSEVTQLISRTSSLEVYSVIELRWGTSGRGLLPLLPRFSLRAAFGIVVGSAAIMLCAAVSSSGLSRGIYWSAHSTASPNALMARSTSSLLCMNQSVDQMRWKRQPRASS